MPRTSKRSRRDPNVKEFRDIWAKVPKELADRFDAIALQEGTFYQRSRSWLAEQAIKEFVERHTPKK